METRKADQQEFSLTLKYLLDNPALLQPPDSKSNEKCKEDKTTDQRQNDLTSAYLGPQIWSDMLLSDDLKLEPVDLDELLNTTGLEDEMGDLSSLMANPLPGQNQNVQQCVTDEQPLADYQDMPSLMSAHRSPDAKQVPSPSIYFQYPAPPNKNQGQEGLQKMNVTTQIVPPLPEQDRAQKLMEMQLFDQQFAILSDIMASNQMNVSQQNQVQNMPIVTPAQPHKFKQMDTPASTLQIDQQHAQFPQCLPQTASFPQQIVTDPNKPDANRQNDNSEYPSSISPITPVEIRIPSPKRVNYVPNTTDVIISTPQDQPVDNPFDPSTRAFTEEELKPQPIIRKSKKVHVPADSKDGKYWNRRNKNNMAAKRSREARRIKENQIAMRANYLEQENAALKTEVAELRKELTKVVDLVKKYEKKFSLLD